MEQIIHWAAVFLLYSFCGWVWESCFVSVCERRWVNRGFLHGPLLPIYGFGAIFILIATLPFRGNPILIFLSGMVAATALEYVTGVLMERLFKVRYWDYSDKKFNVNGHICLSGSIVWGVFSILLVKLLQPLVDQLLANIPPALTASVTLVLTIGFAVDVVCSVQAALKLKQLLMKLTRDNEELKELAHKAELAKEDLLLRRTQAEEEWSVLRQNAEADLSRLKAEGQARRREREMELFSRWNAAELGALDQISEALERRLERLEYADRANNAVIAAKRKELRDTLQRIQTRKASVSERTIENYRQAGRILRGNPSAKTKDYPAALAALREAVSRTDDVGIKNTEEPQS